MSLIKKIAGAWAVKEGVEWIQERRHPKRSLVGRVKGLLVLGGLGSGAYYLHKTGKLQPLIEKATEMVGSDEGAPGAVTGDTTSGTSSTAQSI